MKMKPIPGTDGFTVSECGTVILNKEKEQIATYRNGDGYITAAVRLESTGKFSTMGVHRLVALAHIPCPGNFSDYQVNHKDLDKENNRKTNIEWISARNNNIHQAIFNSHSKRILIIAYSVTSGYLGFKHIYEAADYYDLEPAVIWSSILNQTPICGFWYLRHRGFKEPLPQQLKKKPIAVKWQGSAIPAKRVLVRDYKTGEEFSSPSMSELARFLGKSTSHVYQCLYDSEKPLKLLLKRYLVTIGDQLPNPTEEEVAVAQRHGSRDVISYNFDKQAMFIFGSAKSFYTFAELSKKAVTVSLKQDRLRKIEGWVFLYDNAVNRERLKAYVDSHK